MTPVRGRAAPRWLGEIIDPWERFQAEPHPVESAADGDANAPDAPNRASEQGFVLFPPQPDAPAAPDPPPTRRRYRLSDEGMAALQANARQVEPWRQSTGPRTERGKARAAVNSYRHGRRSAAGRALATWATTSLRVALLVLWFTDGVERVPRRRVLVRGRIG